MLKYRLIVGLGNYPDAYRNTYHNVGFWFADYIVKRLNLTFSKKKEALLAKYESGDFHALVIKPLTLMNNSGEAVFDIAKKYKIKTNEIIILYDDIDLNIGDFRFRMRGSGGTHNGMKSVIYQMDSMEIARIRIGISKPPEHCDLAEYVLSNVPDENKRKIFTAIEQAYNSYLI